MRQALHIFKKDVHYLRREIGLMLMLTAALAWMATHASGQAPVNSAFGIEMLIIAAGCYLIARVVHAEAIPGDRQFWTTRPYRWRSLLAAKILFIFVFVNLPIFFAQTFIVVAEGFPLGATAPGLLWCLVLLFAGVALPVAALAAVTSGAVMFIFSAMTLLGIGLHVPWAMMHTGRLWFGTVEWIRDSIGLTLGIVVALAVLYWQYRKRWTSKSRIAGALGLVLTLAAYASIGWSTAFNLQSRFSKQTLDPSALSLTLDAQSKGPAAWERRGFVQVDLPIRIAGIPQDTEVEIDALVVTLENAKGQTWKSRSYDSAGASYSSDGSGFATFHSPMLVDRAFFTDNRDAPLKLRASLYATAFGNARSKAIPMEDTPVDVMDGLQCMKGVANTVVCRSAFRWPGRLVEAKTGEGRGRSLTRFISYSPFPSGMVLNPIEMRWAPAFIAGQQPSQREVTIMVKEPLAHVRRDLSVNNFRLADFASVRSGPVVLGPYSR